MIYKIVILFEFYNMNMPIKKTSITTLFNCIKCKVKIQTGRLKIQEDEILCNNCYTNYKETSEFPKKNIPEFSFANKSHNSDFSYFNVIYEREQKEKSESSKHRNFDRRICNRDLSENINSNNVIDFSLTFPIETSKNLFNEEIIDNYINSKQYKLNSKNLSSCCICLNDYNKNDMMIKLRCKHVFHSACMLSWLSLNSSCPICRCYLEF